MTSIDITLEHLKSSNQYQMQNISNVKVQEVTQSNYFKLLEVQYVLNGKTKTSYSVTNKNCVAIIIYNTTRNELVFIKQFRAPRYFQSIAKKDRNGSIDVGKYPAGLGVAIELCAGLVDKEASLEQIAVEEVLEECGYKVKMSCLEKIQSLPSGIIATSISHIYYCEVTDAMKVSEGGGIDNELIEVVGVSIPKIKEFLVEKNSSLHPYVLYSIYWFLENKMR